MSAHSKGRRGQADALTDHTQPHIKKHYYNIFDDALAVMLIVDPKSGQIVDANLAAERFYGWSRARLRQMHISEINTLPLDQLRAQLEAAHRAHRTQLEFRHRRADGSTCDVEAATGWTHDGDRALVYSIVHGISARKAAEEELRKLSRAVEESPESIVITDTRAQIEYVNQASRVRQFAFQKAVF